jgi:hypothetical protein
MSVLHLLFWALVQLCYSNVLALYEEGVNTTSNHNRCLVRESMPKFQWN